MRLSVQKTIVGRLVLVPVILFSDFEEDFVSYGLNKLSEQLNVCGSYYLVNTRFRAKE